MNWNPITREEIAIRLKVEPEFISVKGNAMASGDDAFDQKVEDGILRRLEKKLLDH